VKVGQDNSVWSKFTQSVIKTMRRPEVFFVAKSIEIRINFARQCSPDLEHGKYQVGKQRTVK